MTAVTGLKALHSLNLLSKLTEFVERKDFGVPYYMYTEPLFVIPTGQVQFEAEADGRECDICSEYDGDYYDFFDMNKPHPPLHPHCRCVYRYVPTGELIDYSDEAEFYR
jgi:hypothetical protein